MEKDLKMYMTKVFMKLNTAEEQREFIMMADDKDLMEGVKIPVSLGR